MSVLHVRHLQTRLEEIFTESNLDMSDIDSSNVNDYKQHFLSRALSAYALHILASVDPSIASAAIVDGFQDNGIDAIYYDDDNKTLWLVQSKWIKAGTGEPSSKDTLAYCQGIKDLIDYKIDRFNERVKKQEPQILNALGNASVKINMILAHTGNQFGQHNQRYIDDLMRELNDPSELCIFYNFNLEEAHRSLVNSLDGVPIDTDVAILNWGVVEEPYRAYYGQVNTKDISNWWIENGKKLVTENIRGFIGSSETNEEITRTLKNSPNMFWYFNNGITVLCDSINKKLLNGNDRNIGVFEVRGLKIVNGAQTVGSIGEFFRANPVSSVDSKVLVKFISLNGCPEDFAVQVTKATNTQNRVEKKDFVSLDPEQERLRTDFALEGINYQYKRSADNAVLDENNCNFEELIIALSCSNRNVDYSTTGKREVSKLWDDLYKQPYTDLFNKWLNTNNAWNCIQYHRKISFELKKRASIHSGRERGIYVHGNLFIEHMMFKLIDVKNLAGDKKEFEINSEKIIKECFDNVVLKTFETVESEYGTSLMHQLFKNLTKTRDIDNKASVALGLD